MNDNATDDRSRNEQEIERDISKSSDEPLRVDESVALSEIPPDVEPSGAVISAVATFEDVDPTALDIFHDTLDPDALNSLIHSGTDEVEVTFRYSGYVITVRGDGSFMLQGADDDG